MKNIAIKSFIVLTLFSQICLAELKRVESDSTSIINIATSINDLAEKDSLCTATNAMTAFTTFGATMTFMTTNSLIGELRRSDLSEDDRTTIEQAVTNMSECTGIPFNFLKGE